MTSKSYLIFKPNAANARILALVNELKAHGCQVLFEQSPERLEFDVGDCKLWWLAKGGLQHVLDNYDDVATWAGEFYRESDAPFFATRTDRTPVIFIEA